jgi:hypothetical protein
MEGYEAQNTRNIILFISLRPELLDYVDLCAKHFSSESCTCVQHTFQFLDRYGNFFVFKDQKRHINHASFLFVGTCKVFKHIC